MLYIICPQTLKYKGAIEAICSHVGLTEYSILDPLSHDLNRPFSYLMILGNPRFNLIGTPIKVWKSILPEKTLSLIEKNQVMSVFKEAKDFLELTEEPKVFKKEEIPALKTFSSFFDSLNSQIVEVLLEDGRQLGIYPDHIPLKRLYQVEAKASTIINLAKIKELFNIKEIKIKDI